MADFNQMMQDIVNKDYDELVAFGKIALGKIMPILKAVDTDHDGMFALTSVVLASVGADGTLTALENKWLKDVMGLQDETIDNMIKLYSSKMEDLTDALFDNAPQEFKGDLMMFVLSILAVDEKISKEETAFVKKLFA